MTPKVSQDPDKIKYVELVRKRWVYRPYIKVADRGGKDVDSGGFLRPIRLGNEGDSRHKIVKAYSDAVTALEAGDDRDRLTLRRIANQ